LDVFHEYEANGIKDTKAVGKALEDPQFTLCNSESSKAFPTALVSFIPFAS
jgi:hypothetical protein